MYQREFNQRSKIRRARQETPIVSVYDISNPQRIYSITVPDSKKWSDFIPKLKTKFNVSISHDTTNNNNNSNNNNSNTSSNSNTTQYTLSIFKEKGSQSIDTNDSDANNPNLTRVDIFNSDMSKIKHKTTLAIELIELNPNAKKDTTNNINNQNSNNNERNNDGTDYSSDTSDNSEYSDSSSFSIGSNYASGNDINDINDNNDGGGDDVSGQNDNNNNNNNNNHENKHKYDFIPSKEIKEMKRLGMTDLDLLSRFSIPSKSKKGQKPLHRYNTKTLGWDPKTLWVALTLKDINCYHENDKWTVIRIITNGNNNNNNNDFEIDPNDDDIDSNYSKRGKNKGIYEESLLQFVTVRVRRLIWPLKYQRIALNTNFNFNLSDTSLTNNLKWAIILCHGGRFAICIFFGKKIIYHKTLRRYVTRKKQGRRQLNYTKTLTTSGPGSAGGQKRAHNEKKLREEIQEILTKCQKYLTPPNWLMKQMSNLDTARNDIDTININDNDNSNSVESKQNDFDDIEDEGELDKVDRIFIHVPGDDQMTIFGNSEEQNYLYPTKRVHNYNLLKYDLCLERLNDVKNKNESSNLNLYRLWKDDKRILKIPMTTYKPTIQECMRIHYWLTTVWIKMDNNRQNKSNDDDSVQTNGVNGMSGGMKRKDVDKDEELFTINEEAKDDDNIDENENENENKLNDNMVDID